MDLNITEDSIEFEWDCSYSVPADKCIIEMHVKANEHVEIAHEMVFDISMDVMRFVGTWGYHWDVVGVLFVGK
jgi:hypothetical protein